MFTRFLELPTEQTNPAGALYPTADDLASHKSTKVQVWFTERQRVHPVYIPTGDAGLNLIEPWSGLSQRKALVGQTFERVRDVERATDRSARKLNWWTKSWIWGRPPQKPPYRRRRFVYLG